MSLSSHYLDKAGTLLFHNSTMQQEMLLAVPKHQHYSLAVTAFDILSALKLSTCDTKGPVMTAKQTPWMRPCLLGLSVQSRCLSTPCYFVLES